MVRGQNVQRVVVIILIVFLMVSCQKNSSLDENNLEEESVVLSRRQKDILEEVGLPSKYSELNKQQRSNIVAIGELLSYVEDKYGEKFKFKGYVPGGLEKEHITLNTPFGVFRAWRELIDGEYVYDDNYVRIFAHIPYSQALGEFIEGEIGNREFKIFSGSGYFISDDMEEMIVAMDEGRILEVFSGTTSVFVDDPFEEGELEEIVQRYAEWRVPASKGQSSLTTFYLVEKEELKWINQFNFFEISESIIIRGLRCYIKESGEISIVPRGESAWKED
ncbi:MAG: hypothetical protein GXZ13_07500 [Synergistaceae bacterium]|nr:hypothetical protein [Synergistaceae bacterium]